MKEKQPLVSVIIPVYNVASYVEKCVRSVEDNTYQNLEIICIDDGSTDESGNLLDALAAGDSRIKVIHQTNSGISGARNRGLSEAKGDYIATIDSDDYIHPQYFESMMHCMVKKNASMVLCKYQSFQEGKEPAATFCNEIHYRKLNCKEFFLNFDARNRTWARIYRKADIGDLLYEKEVHISDDTLFNVSVVSNMENPRIYMTDFPMYYYLERASSLIHTTDPRYYIGLGKWYLKNQTAVERGSWDTLVCLEAVKLTLACRYLTSFQDDRKERAAEANKILKICIQKLRKDRKNYMLHTMMYLLPPFYRACRIINDPTMLEWEKTQKQKADQGL